MVRAAASRRDLGVRRPGSASSSASSSNAAEDLGECLCCRGADVVDRRARRPSSRRHRRELVAVEPARRDPVGERRRVEVDVQRVAVRRDPLRQMDPDRSRSCAAATRARRRSGRRFASPRCRTRPIVRMSASSRSRQYFFTSCAVPRQVEDRVADELSGRVVGRLAAAVDLDDRRPPRPRARAPRPPRSGGRA